LDDVIALAKDAYGKADAAAKIAPSLTDLVKQLQTIAGNMANEARTLKAGGKPAQ
jgi:hypothetical protein